MMPPFFSAYERRPEVEGIETFLTTRLSGMSLMYERRPEVEGIETLDEEVLSSPPN